MPQQTYHILVRRGLQANLPAEGLLGEIFFCTDTSHMFVGAGPGLPLDGPIGAVGGVDATSIQHVPVLLQDPTFGQILIFDEATGKYVPGDPIVSGPDAIGIAPTRNPVQVGLLDSDGNVAALHENADGGIPVHVNNVAAMVLDAGNSSNTLIPNLNHFVGTPRSTAGFNTILLEVFSDQALLVQVQYSNDNGATYPYSDQFTSTPSIGSFVTSPVKGLTALVSVFNFSGVNTTVVAISTLLLPFVPADDQTTGVPNNIAPSKAKQIAGQDINGNLVVLRTLNTGVLEVTVDGSVLPTGAATSAAQATGNSSLASIDGKTPALISGRVPVDPSGVTSPVSVVSLPLPSGAATEATLAAVNTKLGSALPLPTGASTEATLALIKAKTDNIDVLLSTRTKPADTQPVSAVALPLPTGAATEATLAAVNTKLAGTLAVSAATLPLPALAATSTKQSDGSQKTQVVDASGNVQPSGDTSGRSIHTTVDNASLAVTAASLPLPTGASQDGTDGSGITAPTAGVGIRGWLSGIYNVLKNGVLTCLGASLARASAAWTSGTAGNTALTATVTGYGTAVVTINQTTTITGGVLTFEASDDNTNWFPMQGSEVGSGVVGGTYTCVASTLKSYQFDVAGFLYFRVRLSTVITGSGTVTVAVVASASGTEPVVSVTGNPQVAASSETGTVFNGAVALTPLFASVVASASGATTIVALVASKKIRVLALQLTANAAVNVKWQSHVTPTDKTGLGYFAANGGYVLPFNPLGWFETIAGEALDINLSAAVAVGGSLTYVTI